MAITVEQLELGDDFRFPPSHPQVPGGVLHIPPAEPAAMRRLPCEVRGILLGFQADMSTVDYASGQLHTLLEQRNRREWRLLSVQDREWFCNQLVAGLKGGS